MIRYIDRRGAAVAALALLIAVAGCRRSPAVRVRRARPNVLFVLLDDLRADALGYAGHPHVKTPHIDRLASEGRLLQELLLHHVALLAQPGVDPERPLRPLPWRHQQLHRVPDRAAELSAALQQAGYATAYIGKWHMGEENDEPRPGFDYFVTHKGQGKYFDTEFNVDGERREVRPGYYTHVVTDLASTGCSATGDKPFLLMLGHKAPHSFYFPEPKYEHAFDDVQVSYPAVGVPARRQAGVVQGPPVHLAWHLRPAVRVAQEVSRRPAGGSQGLRDHDARLLGHDPLRR